MAKITTKQIQQINNMCSNGWRLDTQYYLFYGEKRLIKCIELDEEHYLEFALYYNYQNQVTLHISKFYHEKDKDYASTSGLRQKNYIRYNPSQEKEYESTNRFHKSTGQQQSNGNKPKDTCINRNNCTK